MLTGDRLFTGDTVSDVLASVLKEAPDLGALPTDTPLKVRDLLRRCLVSDPGERLRDIGDGRIELLAAIASPTAPTPSEPLAKRPPGIRPSHVATGLVAMIMGVVVGWFLIGRVRPVPSAHAKVSRFSLTLPEEAVYLHDDWPLLSLAISPDGSKIAYRGEDRRTSYGVGQLYLRSLDDVEVRPIPETESARQPFFSPNGQWLAFFNSSGELKKVNLEGGRPMTVARGITGSAWSFGSWGDDGSIVFSVWESGLFIVPSDGGQQRALTTPQTMEMHYDPHLLPGSRAVLFAASSPENERVRVLSLDTDATTTVLENAGNPRYLSSGHLLFTRENGIMAAPFDIGSLDIAGPAVPLPLSARFDAVQVGNPKAQLAVSDNGTLVYAPASEGLVQQNIFTWVDRQGRIQETATIPVSKPLIQLSPSGHRAIVSDMQAGTTRHQILDFASGTLGPVAQFRQLELKGALWSPDDSLIFVKADADGIRVTAQASTGATPTDLFDAPGVRYLTLSDISSDGRLVAFMGGVADNNGDVLVFDTSQTSSDSNPMTFVGTPAHEHGAKFSPDGRWLAYVSDEAGHDGVYVRSFPDGELKQIVSTGIAMNPMWSPDGREIFYLAPGAQDTESGIWNDGSRLMAVPVEVTPQLQLGEPRQLFDGPYYRSGDLGASPYGVSPDGSSFLMVGFEEDPLSAQELILVLNWFEELKRLVPTE
jgi:serine/threonine-protein kinase